MSPETNDTHKQQSEVGALSVEKKSGPEAYLEALQSKKDVLDAFYQMNAFRKNKDPNSLTAEDRRSYDILKTIWQEKKRQNVAIVDQLDGANLDKILGFGMDVHAVGAELTLLRLPKDTAVSDPEPARSDTDTSTPNPEVIPPIPVPRPLRVEPAPATSSSEVVVPRSEREVALTNERYRERMKTERIANLKSELADVELKLATERAKIYGSDIERRGQTAEIKELEDRKKEIEAEIELLEKGALGVFRDRVKAAYKKTVEAIKGDPTKKTKWGWVKERLKGLATAGIWEVVVAERVRGAGNSGEDTYESSKNQVNVDRATTKEGTEDYAWKLQREAEKKGLTLAEVDKKHEDDNNLFIENQANATVEDVMTKIKKAKGFHGQNMNTPENQAAIKADVVVELTKIRMGMAAKSEAEMKKFIQNTLDDKWTKRYIWAGIEAALWLTGAATIIFRPEVIAAPALPGHPPLFTPDKFPIPPGLENQYINMSNTVWETVSKMFPGASDALIMAKSKAVIAANHLFEPEWLAKVAGEISTRVLPQSFLLKLPAGFLIP